MAGMHATTRIRELYDNFGPRKPTGPTISPLQPHYFLLRTFLDEQDLVIIFNTKRCRFQCDFCDLPLKSSRSFISGDKIIDQFLFVVNELKHSLSIIDRLTISNDGSVLDDSTFPT